MRVEFLIPSSSLSALPWPYPHYITLNEDVLRSSVRVTLLDFSALSMGPRSSTRCWAWDTSCNLSRLLQSQCQNEQRHVSCKTQTSKHHDDIPACSKPAQQSTTCMLSFKYDCISPLSLPAISPNCTEKLFIPLRSSECTYTQHSRSVDCKQRAFIPRQPSNS